MSDTSPRLLTLSDVVLTTNAPAAALTSYGYVIDGNAHIHALCNRFYHGVVLAILYPDLAQKEGYALPEHAQHMDHSINVFHYQEFEHKVGGQLPVLRVSHSQLTGITYVSYGAIPPSEDQIQGLLAVFKAMGLSAQDTLTGDEDDITVQEYIDELRQLRQSAATTTDITENNEE